MYSRFSEIIAIFPMAVNEYCIGLEYGWITPTIVYLKEPNPDLRLNANEISWVASMHELGRFLGPLLVPILTKFFGRKQIIIMVAGGNVLCWIGVSFTRLISVLYGARLLIGMLVGVSDVVSSMYVGELSSPAIRGRSTTILLALQLCGVLSANILGTYLSYSAHASTILGVAVLVFAACGLLVESPQYLISIGREELAKKNLWRIRGHLGNDEVHAEFEIIKQSLETDNHKRSLWTTLSNPVHIRLICLMASLSLFSFLTGFLSISYYSNFIFPSNNLLTSNELTMIFAALQVSAVFTSSIFIELCGRRFLLLMFSLCAVALHFTTAGLYFLKEKMATEIPGFSWLIFGTVVLYSTLFSFGCSPTNFVLRSELFPLQLKSIGGTLTVFLQSASVFLESKIFMTIIQLFGIYCNFLMYAFFAILLLLVTFFYLPETKGKSLAEIQSHFYGTYS